MVPTEVPGVRVHPGAVRLSVASHFDAASNMGGEYAPTPKMLEEAIRKAIQRTSIFAEIDPQAPVELSVLLRSVEQDLDVDAVHVALDWKLLDAASKTVLWRQRIETTGTDKSFAAAVRLRNGSEAAFRNNIATAFQEISALEFQVRS